MIFVFRTMEVFDEESENIMSVIKSVSIMFWIKCTSRFNARSRIIENNLRGCFFPISSPAGTYPYLFS